MLVPKVQEKLAVDAGNHTKNEKALPTIQSLERFDKNKAIQKKVQLSKAFKEL